MDDLQFLKEELSNAKLFNKRIFYAKNALRYTEIMPINFFINNYIPYIANYIYNEENVEEVLTEYSNTFTYFLKFLGKEENFQNYNNKEEKNIEDNRKTYNNSIYLILKCFFEKILLNEDEILKETTINNIKELLLDLDQFPLLKTEFENILYQLKILINNETNENKDINEENELYILFFSLLYPFIESDEKKIENFCIKFKSIIYNNSQLKKMRLLIQNIINIIPFIKKSIDNIKEKPEIDNVIYLNIINKNIYILKEIICSLNNIMDDNNFIARVGMDYLCEIILAYTIKNITEFIIFYDEYNKYLSNIEINSIINNFITKLENFINIETNLGVKLNWRVKVAYIENICKLNSLVNRHNQKYFDDYFSQYCLNILSDNKNKEQDLKISVLNHIDLLIPSINKFLPIFNDIIIMNRNQYILSALSVSLNNILNNQKFYEINTNETIDSIASQIFQFFNELLKNENFEIRYHLLSSFDFLFFNYINNDKQKILLLSESIKLYIFSFQKINEWRIRYNLYEKFKKFLSEKDNILKIYSFYQIAKNNPENEQTINLLINNIRYLIHLIFLDKANIIRMNSLELINDIINFQKDNKINTNIYLIRIKEELMKYQISIFCKNSNTEENIINNLNLLDMNKNYCMKLFFLESVKKFINLYSTTEKNIIKEILKLIKNDSKYSKENVANNKIYNDIEIISKNLKEINN